MNNVRLAVLGALGAVFGFTVQGCFTAQPVPECTVLTGDAVAGVTNYWGMFDKQSATGTCPDLKGMEIGLARFHPPGTTDFTIAVRPKRMVAMFNGEIFTANQDYSNDCNNQAGCDLCVVALDDGGISLSDGTPIADNGDGTGVATYADGGMVTVPDTTNTCGVVDEPIYRVDPADKEGKNITALAKFEQFPDKAGVCAVTNFNGNVQNFQAETVTLADGTSMSLPALPNKYVWTNFNVLMNANVPGTAWTADLAYTEGDCQASYKVTAFWPIIGCAVDEDCNPDANLDAGRVIGSGINPGFAPKCDTDLSICVPSVDISKLK